MSGALSLHRLVPHPDTPSEAIERIDVALERSARGLKLAYRLVGDAQRVVVARPGPGGPGDPGEPPRRRDELWRGTCCELFLREAAGAAYLEYNFAPHGDWAAYRFSGYRAGCTPLETPAPLITLERSSEAISVTVDLPLHRRDLPLTVLDPTQRIGLACVVATDSEVSYWALAHPPGKPDFHHASAFHSSAFASMFTIAHAANDGP